MTRLAFLLFFVSIIGMGCKEDFFESIVDLEVSPHTPQLAVSAHFNDVLDDRFRIFVGKSVGMLDSTATSINSDVTIDFFEEARLIESKLKKGNLTPHLTKIAFQPDLTYSIQLTSEEFGNAKIAQQAPTQVKILNASYNERKAIDRFGERGEEVAITFQDPAGEKNFYELLVLADIEERVEDTTLLTKNISIFESPIDPIIEDTDGKLLFSDVTFDGQEYTIKFVVFLEDQFEFTETFKIVKLHLYLLSTTQDYHSYWISLQNFYDNQDNIFAEPTNVYENVEGGNGIFTIGTGDVFTVEF